MFKAASVVTGPHASTCRQLGQKILGGLYQAAVPQCDPFLEIDVPDSSAARLEACYGACFYGEREVHSQPTNDSWASEAMRLSLLQHSTSSGVAE